MIDLEQLVVVVEKSKQILESVGEDSWKKAPFLARMRHSIHAKR